MLLRGLDWLRAAITPLTLRLTEEDCPYGTPGWVIVPGHRAPQESCVPVGDRRAKNRGMTYQKARDEAGTDRDNPNVFARGATINPRTGLPDRSPVPYTPPTHQGEPCPPGQHRPDRRGPCVPTPHDPRVSDREVVCRNRGWVWTGDQCVDPARIRAGGELVARNRAAKAACEERGGTWTPGGEGQLGSCAEPPVADPDPDPPPPPDPFPPPDPLTGGVPTVTDYGVTAPAAAAETDVARTYFEDALPTFGAEGGPGTAYPLPAPYRPASWADLMRDPRMLTAQREQEERLRAAGAAAGVEGAPLLSAIGRGRQDLLGRLAGAVRAEDRDAWGAGLERARAGQDLEGALWGRAFDPARTALDYGLRSRALERGTALDERGLDLRAQEQGWRQRFLPWQAQAGFRHAVDILGRTHAHERGLAGDRRLWDLIYGGINQPYVSTTLPW